MSELILASLEGFPAFFMYFFASVVAIGLFARIYSWITPHDEVRLIKENNAAAATAFVGALVGFSLPLYSALANSVSLVDFAVWALTALLIQIVTFMAIRKFIYPKLSERIEAGEIAAAIKIAGAAIVVGMVNAGSMTY